MPLKGYVSYRVQVRMQIDGQLDEDTWKVAPSTDAFVEIQGNIRPRQRFETCAKMLWGDSYFHFSGLAETTSRPGHVVGSLAEIAAS